MNRAFSKIFIVFLVLILIFIGAVFYVYQQREKQIESLGEEYTREELLKMAEEQACEQLISALENKEGCQQFENLDYREACYRCFAQELEKEEAEESSPKEEVIEEKKPPQEEVPSWGEVYTGFLLSSEAKEFLNQVFQKSGKYPTEKSTEEEKQFYLQECDAVFQSSRAKREGCYQNIASFTKDEDICEIVTPWDRGFCFFNIAVLKKDSSICEKINVDTSFTSDDCKGWFEATKK